MGAGRASTRALLTRLRTVSAGRALDNATLAAIVAEELPAEVCSIYVADGRGELVLKAAVGLRADAIGVTRLRPGEGVIGTVVATGRIVSLDDASHHPAFAPRPETGEARFPAMLAVPVCRAGTVLGALVVQGASPRSFGEDDGEALQTAAMLLAEVIGARGSPIMPDDVPVRPRHFRGVTLSGGTVRGRLLLGPDARVPGLLAAADPVREERRLTEAVDRLQHEFDALLEAGRPDGDAAIDEAARDVLDATRLLTRGGGWVRRLRDFTAEGLSAEAAVDRLLRRLRRRMRAIGDSSLRERLADLEEIGLGLLETLATEREDGNAPLPPDTILLARRLGPAKLLHWHARGIAGLIVEEASPAGHAAILARSLGLPALGGVEGAVAAAAEGQDAILDAVEGHLFLRPDPAVVRIYARDAERDAVALERLRLAPDRTEDGQGFRLELNAGLPQEINALDQTGAAGVGLFRTEIFVLARGLIPSESEQLSFYGRVLDRAGGRPVTFRTFDLGSDKMLHDQAAGDEANPAMGWRSLRVGLDQPDGLARQVRALLGAANGRPIRIMFPMVATVAEFIRARAVLEGERARLGLAPVPVGVMLEVPALLFELPALFAAADFVSVGSNDLFQFLFAADRGSVRMANRYGLFDPAALSMIEFVVAAARAAGKTVSVCGELAGRPIEAVALLAVGVGVLSMSPFALPRVKSALSSVVLARVRAALERGRREGLAPDRLRAVVAEAAGLLVSAP